MSSDLAPVIIFAYRREISKLINSLKTNSLHTQIDLIIYSDGNKNDTDLKDVIEVRKFLRTIKGFKNIKIIESPNNKGLANSIIDGVSEILDKYGKIIVLEDDLIVSNDFLEYMNNALDFYQNKEAIWSISGYGPNLPCLENYNDDLYLSVRGSSWGWATWKDRWDKVDWEVKDFDELKQDKSLQNKFNLGGNDMYKMLELQMLGKIDSWAIRWCYSQFKLNAYTVYPKKSKIKNDGFSDEKGTHHSRVNNKWVVELDNEKINFKDLNLKKEMIECFNKYYNISIIIKISYFLKKYRLGKILKYLRKKIHAM